MNVILISLVACAIAFLWHRYDQFEVKNRRKDYNDKIEKGLGSALESISGSTTLIKFKYEEISAKGRSIDFGDPVQREMLRPYIYN